MTVSALIAMNRPDQLRSHGTGASNGVTEEELVEAITQLAFYAAGPTRSVQWGSPEKCSRNDVPANGGTHSQIAPMITRRHILAGGGVAALALAVKPAAAQGGKEPMKITRSNSQPSRKGPAEHFTGSVRVDTPFRGTEPARAGGGFVTFEPGARTAWHTHPLGQTLIITMGSAGASRRRPRKRFAWRCGLVSPGVKHWHGATATQGMTTSRFRGARRKTDWMGR